MQTGRAIIIAALIVSATGGATAWLIQPRYSLTNIGQGVSIRLDRRSGDLVGCEELACRAIEAGPADPYAAYSTVVPAEDEFAGFNVVSPSPGENKATPPPR